MKTPLCPEVFVWQSQSVGGGNRWGDHRCPIMALQSVQRQAGGVQREGGWEPWLLLWAPPFLPPAGENECTLEKFFVVKASDNKISAYFVFSHFGKYTNERKVILKSTSRAFYHARRPLWKTLPWLAWVVEEKFLLFSGYAGLSREREIPPTSPSGCTIALLGWKWWAG